jgi:hypothetical protein
MSEHSGWNSSRWFFRLLAASLFVVTVAIFIGCGGGGGGSLPQGTAEDSAKIAGQVGSFMTALRSGDPRSFGKLFSQRMQMLSGAGDNVQSFVLWDLGADVFSTTDDASFTFFIDPSQIIYLSDTLAQVTTWTHFPDGSKFSIGFQFLKENGAWVIDFLEVKPQEAATVGTGGLKASVDLLPLANGNQWRFIDPGTISENRGKSLLARVDTDPENRDEVKVFSVAWARNISPVDFGERNYGIEASAVEFGKTNDGTDAVAEGFFPKAPSASSSAELWNILDPKRTNQTRFSNTLGLFCWGNDEDFNGGLPWRMAGLVVKKGARTTQTISLPDQTGLRTVEMRTMFMGNSRLDLPIRTFSAIRLDISARFVDTGEVLYASWFFEPGIGPIAFARYDETTRRIDGQEFLMAGLVSNVGFSAPGQTPGIDSLVVRNLIPFGRLTAGSPFTHTFIASGGVPPYSWAVASAPTWMAVGPETGQMDLIPATIGTFTFSILARDSGELSAQYDLQWFAHVSSDTAFPVVRNLNPASGAAEVALTANVRVGFNKTMATYSFNPDTFQVFEGTATVSGKIIGEDQAGVFRPLRALKEATKYTVAVGTGVTDLSGNPLLQPLTYYFTTIGFDRPQLIRVLPLEDAVGVGTARKVGVRFSRLMDLSSVSSETFQVVGSSGVPLAGTFSTTDGSDILFTPDPPFQPVSSYTATLGIGVRDTGGVLVGETKTWSFTTDSPPQILRLSPPDLGSRTRVIGPITVEFDRHLLASTLVREHFFLESGGVILESTLEVASGGFEARLTPVNQLQEFTIHTATIASFVQDNVGNYIQGRKWSFFTGAGFRVESISPADEAQNVVTVSSVTVSFNHPVDVTSISSATFFVASAGVTLPGSYSFLDENQTVVFTPNPPFKGLSRYRCKVLGTVKNDRGQLLGPDKIWNINTDSRPTAVMAPGRDFAWASSNPSQLIFQFSKPIKVSSVANANFRIEKEDPAGNVVRDFSGPPTVDSDVQVRYNMVATPFGPPPAAVFRVTMADPVFDHAGNPLDIEDPSGQLGQGFRFANTFSRGLGTPQMDEGIGVATDSAGNVYVCGNTRGHIMGEPNAGGWDCFVTKYSPQGVHLWTKSGGSPVLDEVKGIAVDTADNVYVVGKTNGFLAAANAGGSDGFVFKMDPNGGIVWKDQFGGSGDDSANDVCADKNGHVYVTGQTTGPVHEVNPSGGTLTEVFISRYPNGTIGPSADTIIRGTVAAAVDDVAQGIAVKPDGSRVYITGYTEGVFAGGNGANRDIFIFGADTGTWASEQSAAYNGGGEDIGKDITITADGLQAWVVGNRTGSQPILRGYLTSNLNLENSWVLGSNNDTCDGVIVLGTSGGLVGTTAGGSGYAAKVDISTGAGVWLKTQGVSRSGIVFDFSGNRIITVGTTDAAVNGVLDAHAGLKDAFIITYDAAGDRK